MSETIYHQTSWSVTSEGTPISLYKKSHTLKKSEKSPILFIGGVHGDEPEGVRLAEELVTWLQSLDVRQMTDLHPWVVIPCINPDGYKNLQRTNNRGVDLNRNFPSSDWSPDYKAPRYSPGPSPGSEKEVQALVQLIEDEKPQLIVHFHSWEPCVVYTGTPGRKAAEILALGTGYEVREDIGYPTPGSLGQFGWLDKKIPVICIEEQEHSDLNEVWPRFKTGLITLLREESAV